MRIIKKGFVRLSHPGVTGMMIFSLFLAALSGINSKSNPLQTPPDSTTFAAYSASLPDSEESIEMLPVPGGTFTMGPIENSGVHEVKVDSFWIGKYEITWNQYNLFRTEVLEDIRSKVPTLSSDILGEKGAIPADIISLPSPPYVDMSFGMGTDGFPAAGMTHYAAYMFTQWLSIKTGEFYRLPTEAEWEYACRAATSGEYKPISDAAELDQVAWHKENSGRKYQKPGTKQPNALGIHDMLGNVAEWTFDQFHEDYFNQLEHNPADNPFFKPTQLYPRSARGGSWMDPAESASCLQRRGSNPQWKMRDPQLPKSLWWHTNASFVGFRVVKPVDQPNTVDEMEKYWIEAMQDYN